MQKITPIVEINQTHTLLKVSIFFNKHEVFLKNLLILHTKTASNN